MRTIFAGTVLVLVAWQSCLAGAAPVTSLPGLNSPLPSAVDSGYIVVDEAHDRRLFYVFVESQRAPTTDPLLIWLNGGPGCSSMFGLFTEHGPFAMNFTSNGTGIVINPFSWTTQANVIYLESPAGVGFSTSNVSSDYNTGDFRTASDSYAFLQGFFDKFPTFRTNDFWVTGESYGGHYVPELVQTILTENDKAAAGRKINLKGMMAGNPWTAPNVEAFGVVENWWDRAIMAEATYNTIRKSCTYVDITSWIIYNVSASGAGYYLPPAVRRARYLSGAAQWRPSSQGCFDALQAASLVQFGDVDIEGVYLDVCNPGTRGDLPYQPNWCAANQMQQYLNLAPVQAALHVSAPLPPAWYSCSPWVNYSFEDTTRSVVHIYKHVTAATSLKVLVYSGDNDAIVPYTGTRKWLRDLNRTIVDDVHEWFSDTNGKQVGGWAINYDRLTFTTVRAAGHMVPFAQPQRALHMFRTFIEKGKL